MPSPSWDDLDVFVAPEDFGVPVVLTMQSGAVRNFSGIFDDPYLNAQLGEYEADTFRPRVTCKESDVSGVTRGDMVVVDGKTFDVLSAPHIDGTGFAWLELAPTDFSA